MSIKDINYIISKIEAGTGVDDEELKFFLRYIKECTVPVENAFQPLRDFAYTVVAADRYARSRWGNEYFIKEVL